MFLLELDSDFQALNSNDKSSQTHTCSKCGKGKLKQRAEMRFVHFYQFPIFPLLPQKQTYCTRCHKVFKRERLTKNVFPLWQIAAKFIGLFVLVLFALHRFEHYQIAQAKEAAVLQAPAKFDVWVVNETTQLNEQGQDDRFKIMQVLSIDNDQVKAKVGQVIYPSFNNAVKAIRLDNLMINSYFATKPKVFDKASLVKLKQQGVIHSAYRPENLSLFGGLVMEQPRPKPFKPTHRPNPLNQEAIGLYQEGDFTAAADLFEQGAKQGSAWAQYNLADMYLKGQGVEVDIDKAKALLQKAADQGFTRAQVALDKLE